MSTRLLTRCSAVSIHMTKNFFANCSYSLYMAEAFFFSRFKRRLLGLSCIFLAATSQFLKFVLPKKKFTFKLEQTQSIYCKIKQINILIKYIYVCKTKLEKHCIVYLWILLKQPRPVGSSPFHSL